MHISGIGGDKLRELKECARIGDLPKRERKQRSDAGSGVLENFKCSFTKIIDEFGEAMPHLTTTKPGECMNLVTWF
jgi:hypothetical protein